MQDFRSHSVILLHGAFEEKLFHKSKRLKAAKVFLTEGRPSLEASRLNAKTLLKAGVRPTVIADNMAGLLFYKGWVREVWLAYQMLGAEGALCDIGGMIYAVLAKWHRVPVYLYPSARKTKLFGDPRALFELQGQRIAPQGVMGFVPLVEWVPRRLIRRIVYE